MALGIMPSALEQIVDNSKMNLTTVKQTIFSPA